MPLSLALSGGGALSNLEPWAYPQDLSNCAANDTTDLTAVCNIATEMLFRLSGRQFGVRTETVRPIAGMRIIGWSKFLPQLQTNAYQNYMHTEQIAPNWLYLKAPVQSVLQVKIDGQILMPGTDYQLFDQRRLVRQSVSGSTRYWPLWQLLEIPDTQTNTFSITYQWGLPVPAGGMMAARELACQLAKSIANEDDCKIADRVTTVTRQGVTQTIVDLQQFIKDGRTGITLVDMWLSTVNPHSVRRRPTVLSPESIDYASPS